MVSGLEGEVGGVTGGGAVLIDREEEELKGEVSTFDLYSSVTSWGHVKRATLSIRAPPVKEEMEHFYSLCISLSFGEKQDQWTQFRHNF